MMISMSDYLATILAMVLVGLLFCGLAYETANKEWKAQLVIKGFAEYSQTTGKWQWKDQPQAKEAR